MNVSLLNLVNVMATKDVFKLLFLHLMEQRYEMYYHYVIVVIIILNDDSNVIIFPNPLLFLLVMVIIHIIVFN